jgi:hypothetical protein
VTSTPTASATIAVRGANTIPASGRSICIVVNTASRPLAMPKPAAMPISEASTPITSASTSTDVSTWRRRAPTIRSSPNSRERWATVIESVLKIVNAPTRIATKPNTIRTMVMIEMASTARIAAKRSRSSHLRRQKTYCASLECVATG